MHQELLRLTSIKRSNDLSLLPEHWKICWRIRRICSQHSCLFRAGRRIQQSGKAMRGQYWPSARNYLQASRVCERHAPDCRSSLRLLSEPLEGKRNVRKKRVLHPRMRLLHTWRRHKSSDCWLLSWLCCPQLRQQTQAQSRRYFDRVALRAQSSASRHRLAMMSNTSFIQT